MSNYVTGEKKQLEKRRWTFLTYHGMVLVYVAKHPQATGREIAQEVGVTEREIQKVIRDLVTEGYLARQKSGRRNTYTVHDEQPMRHMLQQQHSVGNLLNALGYNPWQW